MAGLTNAPPRLLLPAIATIAIQRGLLSSDRPSEIWFGLRCSLAYAIDDHGMIDRLVEEARDNKYTDATQLRVNAAPRQAR